MITHIFSFLTISEGLKPLSILADMCKLMKQQNHQKLKHHLETNHEELSSKQSNEKNY